MEIVFGTFTVGLIFLVGLAIHRVWITPNGLILFILFGSIALMVADVVIDDRTGQISSYQDPP